MDALTEMLKETIRQQAVTVFLNEFACYCLENDDDSDDVDNETVKETLQEMHSKYFTAAYNEAVIDFIYNKTDDEIQAIAKAHLLNIKDAMTRSEMLDQLQTEHKDIYDELQDSCK